MKAIVLREVGQPTAVEELALRPVGRHEVRVRLRASGVCHSDLSLRDGSIPTLLPCDARPRGCRDRHRGRRRRHHGQPR